MKPKLLQIDPGKQMLPLAHQHRRHGQMHLVDLGGSARAQSQKTTACALERIFMNAAFDWYLARSPDAARKFDAEVKRAITQMVEAPTRWATGLHSTRRFLLHRFPFVKSSQFPREQNTQLLEGPALKCPRKAG